tara:strand:+ start:1013 stop:1207 length:195 start_codon:yes stop_codon:yes gene_type:complete
MSYKKQLKKRIKEIEPNLKIGKIKHTGGSFSIVVKNLDIDLKQLEHELVETLCMPGLTLIPHGE